jgi:hypothetical protein
VKLFRVARSDLIDPDFHSLGCSRFIAFLANCVSYPLSTFYALLTDGPLVSRPVSRQSRLGTLVFPGKKGGFAAEGVGFELGEFES